MFFGNEFSGSLTFVRFLLVLVVGLAPVAVTFGVKLMLYKRRVAEDTAPAAGRRQKTLPTEDTVKDFAIALANGIENFQRSGRRITVNAG